MIHVFQTKCVKMLLRIILSLSLSGILPFIYLCSILSKIQMNFFAYTVYQKVHVTWMMC